MSTWSRTTATFESRCAVCDRPIHEGDPIALLEEDGEWVHAECAEDAA